MKRIFALVLVCVMMLSLSACGERLTVENAAGKYKTVGLFIENEYTLKENGTFETLKGYDSSYADKGTYSIEGGKKILLDIQNDISFSINKEGDLYYVEGWTDSFDKDAEYGAAVSFDDNGRSNQSFEAGARGNNYYTSIELKLKEDGTYSSRYTVSDIHNITFDNLYILEESREGTYRFENDVLWLSYEGTEYPMLLVKGELFYNIVEKVQ